MTPWLKCTKEQMDVEKEFAQHEHTTFRGNEKRCKQLGPELPDNRFSDKEICRWLSVPIHFGQDSWKRLRRFLVGRNWMLYKYLLQRASTSECFSDIDWAGCPKIRKSTSGGCLMLGGHLIKSWSSTQPSISFSSGEAEYYGVVKAAGIALGHQSLMADMAEHDIFGT